MDQQKLIPVTFIMTKVSVGNFTDDAIEANRSMNCAAAAALLAAIHQINHDEVTLGDNPIQKDQPINTVSARSSLDLDTCIKLANRCAKRGSTSEYKNKRDIYLNLKKKYGRLKDMNPQDRAVAMADLRTAAYSYLKIDVRFNLEETVFLKLKHPKKDGKTTVETKTIRCLSIHKLCPKGYWPSEAELQDYIQNQLLNDMEVKWEEKEKDTETSSDSKDKSSKLKNEAPLEGES